MSETIDLRVAFDAWYESGRIDHGDLSLLRSAYHHHLHLTASKHLGVYAGSEEIIRFTAGLHNSDLYLSVACTERSDLAWRRLRHLYFRLLTDQFLGLTRRGRDTARDEADTLLNDLFLPDTSGRSRIGSYDGRSSLSTWLRVIVNHRCINERQKHRKELLLLDETPETHDGAALAQVEGHLLRGRYNQLAARALEQACLCLTPEERQLLLWRYDNHLRLGEIAGRLTLHQSNVTRQIEKICARIQALVVATLVERHQLSAAAVEECFSFAQGAFSEPASIIAALRGIHDAQRLK